MYLVRSMSFAFAVVIAGAIPLSQAANLSLSVFTNGGNVSASPGGCLLLTSALGQPLQNIAAGGKYQIKTGFLAAVKTDAIFHGTFEVCS